MAGAGFLTALSPFVFGAIGGLVGFAIIAALMGILYPLTNSVAAILIGGGVGAFIVGFVGFFVPYILFILVPPVVMLENVGVMDALRRSAHLVRRSFLTAMGAVFIMFLIPAIIAGTISFVVNISAKAFDRRTQAQTESTAVPRPAETENVTTVAAEAPKENDSNWNWTFGRQNVGTKAKEPQDVATRLRTTFFESLIQIFWLPMQILVFSFSAIIVALLYLKTRMAGGESANDLIERFEDDGRPRKKWQERVRQRLIQSGRISSKS